MRQAQAGVPHLSRLLTEDGPQQFLLWGNKLLLPFGANLAHQDITGLHLGADTDDALLIQVSQCLLAHIGDVTGDLLRTQLGIAGLRLMLDDMD